MQAFEANPPPLTTGPEGVIRVSGTRISLETVVYAVIGGELKRANSRISLPVARIPITRCRELSNWG